MSSAAGAPASAASVANRRRTWRAVYPYVWLAPAFVIMGGILIYPWTYSLIMSLYSWTPLRPAPPRFIGLDNYIFLVTDPDFHAAFWNTAVLVATTVTLQFFIGFALALMLNMIRVGRAVLTAALLVPLMVTPSVVGLSWRFILHQEWGLANFALRSLGLAPISWLADPTWTMPTIILVDTWQQTPFTVLVLLAGLQAIPDEPVEAARVDGANDRQVFWHVTLPYLQPLIVTVLLFRLIFSVRQFDVVFALFQSGGPGNAGQVLGVYLYEHLRLTWRLGEGSAISYMLLFITIALGASFLVRWYRNVED
jgi:multiple sugar transport system permease protein